MKELKKLALILSALGITANVVNEEITYNGVHDYDNIFCECDKGLVHFDVWHDNEEFELHFTYKDTLVYDTLHLDTLVSVVSEITSTISKFEG
nr:MAG TPA: hypothetical protein [Caudoviricetes sp.]